MFLFLYNILQNWQKRTNNLENGVGSTVFVQYFSIQPIWLQILRRQRCLKWWAPSIDQVSIEKEVTKEHFQVYHIYRWMKVAQCSWAVRKIYLHIVCGTPIPPPSLICRGENVGTYTISTREHPWWYSTVLARRIRPHPPFFATWARFFTKRFTTPVLVAMRLTLDTGSTFFEFCQIELCQIAENGIQDLDKMLPTLTACV